MSFTNLYYKRITGTPKACFVCYKPTTTCLATIKTVDFFYTCDTHLTDRGFASPFVDPESASSTPKPSAEEIAKVKEEWDEKQKRKAEKEREKEKDKDAEKKDDAKDKDTKDREDSKSPKLPGSLTPSSSTTPAATHQRFTLHRDMYALRVAEHRRRKQAAQAKELAPRLPGAPKGVI